jgi:hypothetical protein
MRMKRRRNFVTEAAAAIGLALAVSVTSARSVETFTATAAVKSPAASASAPVTIRIERFVSDAEREKILAAVKAHDTGATQKALAAMADIGFIELGKRRTPIKYAYARPSGDGRLITVVTAKPILFLGASVPEAKPKEGYDLALALLVLDARGSGEGELAPAATVKMDGSGALVTDEYGSEVIRLTSVAKAK